MNGLTTQIDEGGVLLSPEAARMLVAVIDRYSLAEGVPLSGSMRKVRSALLRGSNPGSGSAEPLGDLGPPESTAWISTSEAGQVMGVSREWVGQQARAGALTTTVIGRARYVDRFEVEAWAAERRASA